MVSLAEDVDTDFAGCHVARTGRARRKVIALSSGKAELAGVIKGSAEGLGLRSLAAEEAQMAEVLEERAAMAAEAEAEADGALTAATNADAPRTTEGEGRPVAMHDDDSTRPSPADAPPLSALKIAR